MEVSLSAEQQERLADNGHEKRDGTRARLVADVVARYLDEEAQFLAAVERGIAAAQRGEFVEEEMNARLHAMFNC